MNEFSREGLGTKLYVRSATAFLAKKIFEECERIEKKFSRFIPSSNLSLCNTSHGGQIDDEFFFLLRKADYFFRASQGMFDITVGGVLHKWGYDEQYSFQEKVQIPSPPNFSLVKVEKQKVSFPKGILLDFGGFGKGYALDKGAEIAKNAKNIILDFGGDLYVKGDAQKIALQNPFAPDEAIGTIFLKNQFFAASSSRLRNWGSRHHLVNPLTNLPANTCAGVFVIGSSGIVCDAASTSLFIAPIPEIAEAFGVEFLAVFPDGHFTRSRGFTAEIFSS
jgi:FAD:protein FMN transferase